MSRPAPTGVHAWPKRSFPDAAKELLQDAQMRMNVLHATTVITNKRNRVVQELSDWERLRDSGSDIRRHVLNHLDIYLLQFEDACTRAGGRVHWARDSEEANRIVLKSLKRHEASASIKIKSMTTEEIGLNAALEHAGIRTHETDLAELIVQLGKDKPSHIVVPALHKNRQQIRDIFLREMKLEKLGDSAEDLISAARYYLRRRFLETPFAISGANFLVAETGSVAIVESEGNGRMCLTLPKVLISIAGIEKVIPCFQDLEVFFETLPRSATGERMNPYNSVWTGVHMSDGPQEFHVILLDNARSEILRDIETRETLKCIRCGACQNVCPVYRQTGGHAYGSVYAGPIGAILTPQLQEMHHAQSLPYASSLCGACYEVCPVKIDIPEVLIHLRNKVVKQNTAGVAGLFDLEPGAMKAMAMVFRSERRFRAAQRLGRIAEKPLVGKSGWIDWLPGLLGGWTQARDLQAMPKETFRDWWEKRDTNGQ